jgi:hypothetical protein
MGIRYVLMFEDAIFLLSLRNITRLRPFAPTPVREAFASYDAALWLALGHRMERSHVNAWSPRVRLNRC